MVVFTCGYCGESVQKPKVEKHYMTKCRNKNPNLSCMDCFKDFIGPAYEEHNKCITEEERYSGKGYVAKEKKGEKKQGVWVEMLASVLDEQKNLPGNVQRIIETISKYQNTPRKKPKFINFVKNVCGNKTNPKDIDQAWDLISVKLADLAKITQNKNQNKSNSDKNQENNKEADSQENNKGSDSQENSPDKSDNILKVSNKNIKLDTEEQNGDTEKHNEDNSDKKLSKKQRKEEKKRKKYEAELQSAEAPPVETEVAEGKKEKKKKNRTESMNGNTEEVVNGKKQKKRKRQDTVNSVNGAPEPVANGVENDVENQENEVVKEKTKKKKLKMDGTEEAEESICLHDQNVAAIEETGEQSSGKFNWHAVIMSVLEKKGNEVPFKRLQKKVLGEYSEFTGREVDDRIAEKFIKKLKSAPNVRVDKNRVLLVE